MNKSHHEGWLGAENQHQMVSRKNRKKEHDPTLKKGAKTKNKQAKPERTTTQTTTNQKITKELALQMPPAAFLSLVTAVLPRRRLLGAGRGLRLRGLGAAEAKQQLGASSVVGS